ncbi:MAG TPA: sulfocyanin-like copper-binding protein [Gemmatimonadales bacterium]|nr:sulfocyanin-like copper-binding protein [Gemmatimonadales bacterium]
MATLAAGLILGSTLAPWANAQVQAPAWITVDSAGRTVTLALEVTHPAGAPSALLNGLREGAAQVVVPLGWTVVWDWRSADSTAPHSLVVMQEREKLPTEGGRPAFTNAMTKSLTGGLAAGQTDHTTFEADQVGWYWFLCGVPGHALQGEWLGLKVDADAKTAGVAMK